MKNSLRRLRRMFQAAPAPAAVPARELTPIEQYLAAGQQPWSPGYWEARQAYIAQTLDDRQQIARFAAGEPLLPQFGYRLDERVIEYPWLFAHLGAQPGTVLDAGGVLSYTFLLDRPPLTQQRVIVYSLTQDSEFIARPNLSYIWGDLRQTILRDGSVQCIVCVSTLEHVGMDNQRIYSAGADYQEHGPRSYREVMLEFQRLLAPNGRLFVTVPFGQYEDHGWLQQFDAPMLADLVKTGAWDIGNEAYYQYFPDGWQVSTAAACQACRYYNIHTQPNFDPDFAAAARAVACLELVKVGA